MDLLLPDQGEHAALLSLTGCAGIAGVLGADVNAYEGKERPIGEVAVLLPTGRAQLARVDGKHVGDNTLGYPSDVRVLSDERELALDCMYGNFQVKRTPFTGGSKPDISTTSSATIGATTSSPAT